MTTLTILRREDLICGLRLSGHTMTAASGSDILCAAISSAAYMTVNTVTDVIGADAEIEIGDGYMNVLVTSGTDECQPILRGFVMHMEGLREQYPKNIKITYKEGVF